MKKQIVTIAREFGSGGRAIGEAVAKKLGYAFYDKDIILKTAEETGLSSDYVEERGEAAPSGNIFSYLVMGRYHNGPTLEDELAAVQKKIILKAVEEGPCVIIGRASDYILKDRPDVLSVYIHGNEEDKAKRIMELYQKDEKEAKKMMYEMDKKRAINYKHLTDREWGEARYYSLCLNSSDLGYEKCVDLICSLCGE